MDRVHLKAVISLITVGIAVPSLTDMSTIQQTTIIIIIGIINNEIEGNENIVCFKALTKVYAPGGRFTKLISYFYKLL